EVSLERGNPVQAAETLFTLGDIARHEGDLERAAEAYARSVELCEGIWPSRTYLGHLNLGLVDVERGRFSRARARFERCQEIFEESGHQILLTWTRAFLLPCLADAGRWEELEDKLDYAASKMRENEMYETDAPRTARMAARMALDAGREALAERLLAFAADQWDGLDQPERAEAAREELASLGE
ncbi:MAG: tetratricopeptide repeat protein, partial [Persicimonas sp.]